MAKATMEAPTKQLITIEPIDMRWADKAVRKSDSLLKAACLITITSQKEYDHAGECLKEVKGMAKNLEVERKKITGPLDNAKRAVQKLFSKPKQYLEQAESVLKEMRVTYEHEQESIRKAQEAKLRRQAEAEEARKKKALEEQARKREEKAAELRRQAVEADAKEKAALEEKARAAEEKAEEKREAKEEVHIAAPIIAPTIQKTKGIITKKNWHGEVIDLMVLVKAIAEGNAPIAFIEPDTQVLDAQARATKDTIKYPGVRFYSEDVVSSGS